MVWECVFLERMPLRLPQLRQPQGGKRLELSQTLAPRGYGSLLPFL